MSKLRVAPKALLPTEIVGVLQNAEKVCSESVLFLSSMVKELEGGDFAARILAGSLVRIADDLSTVYSQARSALSAKVRRAA